MANDSIRGRQVVYRLTNKSGGALVEGDVVILSSGTAAAVTTTTTAGLATDVIGVCLESIAGDAIGRVCFAGFVPKINLSASASLGDTVATHSVAKQAAPAASRGAGHFGEVLGTGTTPAAWLWGVPDGAAGGAVATDVIWDAAGDLVQGTGANTGARLAIGTANQLLRTNAAANAVEWASVGRVLISEQTPTGTGTCTFSSIPATFRNLQLEYVARSTSAGVTEVNFTIYLNNDTTATNYRMINFAGYGASYTYSAGADTAVMGRIAAATAVAGSCSTGKIDILQYAGTTFNKHVLLFGSHRPDASTEFVWTAAEEWENTAAVNRVDIVLASGNYDTGSTFRLYGVF